MSSSSAKPSKLLVLYNTAKIVFGLFSFFLALAKYFGAIDFHVHIPTAEETEFERFVADRITVVLLMFVGFILCISVIPPAKRMDPSELLLKKVE